MTEKLAGELLDEAGVPNRVVNTHWLADQIARHLANHSGVILSHEDVLLETGGGVVRAPAGG